MLDDYYSAFPEEVKSRGIISFASRPPHSGFMVTQLWDRFMRSDWRNDRPKMFPPDKHWAGRKIKENKGVDS